MASKTKLEILGRHIKRLRQERDLSQEALADKAGLNRNSVSAIERGKSAAGADVLFKLADAFGVTPGTLFEPFDEPRQG